MYDEKGIMENLEVLRAFGQNFRFDRDADATPEEDLKSKYSMIKDLKTNGIPLKPEQ